MGKFRLLAYALCRDARLLYLTHSAMRMAASTYESQEIPAYEDWQRRGIPIISRERSSCLPGEWTLCAQRVTRTALLVSSGWTGVDDLLSFRRTFFLANQLQPIPWN